MILKLNLNCLLGILHGKIYLENKHSKTKQNNRIIVLQDICHSFNLRCVTHSSKFSRYPLDFYVPVQ